MSSKQLISQDDTNNISNYKYTFCLDIPKICKDDLVILPEKLRRAINCSSNVALCKKVYTSVHFIDVSDGKMFQLTSMLYFQYENDINIIPLKSNSSEFMIMNIDTGKDNLNQSFNNSAVGHKLDVFDVI